MPKIEGQQRTRKSLKMIFQKGKLPTEASFGDLIDSTLNIMDDGINKSEENGYEIAPQGKSKSLLSFYKNLEDKEGPIWQFLVRDENNQEDISLGNQENPDALYFNKDGFIGVNTNRPILPLTVNDFVGMKGRIGTYQTTPDSKETNITVKQIAYGDGKYHDIIMGIKHPTAFEIVAKINGPAGRGKQAMTHAIAVCTDWTSRFNRVRHTSAFYGWPWNRIKLRWKKDSSNESLSLQIKTRSHFGIDAETAHSFKIGFHITELWNDEYMDKLGNL